MLGATHFAPRYWRTWIGVAILAALAPLPLVLTRAAGAGAGLLMFVLNRKRRRVARTNLDLCFPNLSEAKRARVLRRHFIVYGQSLTDIAHLVWSRRRRLERMMRWHGLKAYRTLVANHRRMILLAPHFVAVNFAGVLLSRECPVAYGFKPPRNEVLDWLLHRARTRFGAAALARGQGLRPVVRAIEAGYAFHFSPDEDLGPRHSVFAPFFGINTATLPTLGRLAALCDAAVVPCLAALTPHGYELILQPPLENFPTGDTVADAAQMNRVIEDSARRMPEQYMWTLKLFKTRPPGELSPYD